MGLNIPPSDTNIQLSDITTANALTTRHGFVKKLSNVATEFFDGTGNYSTPAGGTPTSGSAYTIIGGSAVAATNGTDLLAAYTTAKLATPQGNALANGNRYTILLLPGIYDLGAATLTLDTEFIDIVGIEPPSWGQVASFVAADLGGTVITSTGHTVTVSVVGSGGDVRIENVCLANTSANTTFAFNPTSNSNAKTVLRSVAVINPGASTNETMPRARTFAGTYIDVKANNARSFGFQGTASGLFIRCVCGDSAFGSWIDDTAGIATGTFIDCEAGSQSFGRAIASGTFIRCRWNKVNTGPMFAWAAGAVFSGKAFECEPDPAQIAFGGASGTMSGTLQGCHLFSPPTWVMTGTIKDCDILGWNGPYTLNVADSTTIANTAVETNFSVNRVLNAADWKIGRAFTWTAWGKFSTDAATPGTLTLRAKFGATVLRTSGAITMVAASTNAGWTASGVIVLRTSGGTGTISTQLKVELDQAAAVDKVVPSNGTVTISTIVANTFQLSAEFSVADADNNITLENFVVVPEDAN